MGNRDTAGTRRVAVWLRVSTEEQRLDSQHDAVERYVQARGWRAVAAGFHRPPSRWASELEPPRACHDLAGRRPLPLGSGAGRHSALSERRHYPARGVTSDITAGAD